MSAEQTITWQQLWDETSALIGSRNQARWLCEQSSGYDGDEFRKSLNEPATQRCVAHLDVMVQRVRAGEPLQYVLGRWSFRHLDLMVDPRVLIPRPETEQIVDIALELLAQANAPVLVADLGTGSGAIGLAIVDEMPRDKVQVWLTDASGEALEVARANSAGLGMKANCVSVAQGDWCEALPQDLKGKFNLIVSNPPYIAEGDLEVEAIVREYEPAGALFAGREGLDDIKAITFHASEWLLPGGWLLLEIGHQQDQMVSSLLTEAGFLNIQVRRDIAGRNRFVLGQAPSI